MTAMNRPPRRPPLRTEPSGGLRVAGWLFVLLLAAGTLARAQIAPLEDLANFPSGTLEITEGKAVKHTFKVWLADSPSRQAQGLMFVRSLPVLHGMLFVYPEPQSLGIWMKNTYIPLDVIFIDERGRIRQIFANAKPHTLDTMRSKEPGLAVLEIGGGEAARLGIRPGQSVRHPSLVRR